MKKIVVILSTAFVVSLFVTTSCKEDDDRIKSKTELLTEKSWRTSKIEIEVPYDGGVNIVTQNIEDCRKDNITSYDDDGTLSVKTGAVRCSGDTNTAGIWRWKDNENTLSFLINGTSSEAEILALDNTTFKTKTKVKYDINGDGVNDFEASIIYTLVAI